MAGSSSENRPHWLKLDALDLEADIAFFEAQLAFVGDRVETAYQQAQVKTYTALKEQLESVLLGVKKSGGQKKSK